MTARFLKRGFTLVELLVVIAIIGVLAVVVLVAINPVQQLARTRDSGRKSAITQIGHAMEAYSTTHNGSYVPEGTTWATALVTAGELSIVPQRIVYSVGTMGTFTCSLEQAGTADWCYDAFDTNGASPAIVYTRMESTSEISKCAAGEVAWFAWSTAAGRGGVMCTANATTPPVQGATTFVD